MIWRGLWLNACQDDITWQICRNIDGNSETFQTLLNIDFKSAWISEITQSCRKCKTQLLQSQMMYIFMNTLNIKHCNHGELKLIMGCHSYRVEYLCNHISLLFFNCLPFIASHASLKHITFNFFLFQLWKLHKLLEAKKYDRYKVSLIDKMSLFLDHQRTLVSFGCILTNFLSQKTQ